MDGLIGAHRNWFVQVLLLKPHPHVLYCSQVQYCEITIIRDRITLSGSGLHNVPFMLLNSYLFHRIIDIFPWISKWKITWRKLVSILWFYQQDNKPPTFETHHFNPFKWKACTSLCIANTNLNDKKQLNSKKRWNEKI